MLSKLMKHKQEQFTSAAGKRQDEKQKKKVVNLSGSTIAELSRPTRKEWRVASDTQLSTMLSKPMKHKQEQFTPTAECSADHKEMFQKDPDLPTRGAGSVLP